VGQSSRTLFLFCRRIGVEDTHLFAENDSAQRTPQARKTLVDDIAAATQLEYKNRELPPEMFEAFEEPKP
jgi:hypothetical protein